jgi:hypothetical protein
MHQLYGKPTKEGRTMRLWLLHEYKGAFFNKMVFSRLFPDIIREITESKTFSRPLNFSEFPKLFQVFPNRGNPAPKSPNSDLNLA